MMMRAILSFVCCMLLACNVSAQTSKKIKTLQKQKKEMQRNLTKSQKQLAENKNTVNVKLKDIHVMAGQIESRQRYIDTMQVQLGRVIARVSALEKQVKLTEQQLKEKKDDYARALQYACYHQSATSPLLFVLSAKSFSQMFRRSRYAREYANYEHTLAQEIVEKQSRLMEQKNELLKVKAEKDRLKADCEAEKARIQKQHDEEKKNVQGLRAKQRKLEKDVKSQRQQLSALDKKIDQMIAYEIEQARKRAEAARRKAEAEARRKAEAARKKREQGKKAGSTGNSSKKTATVTPKADRWITPQDRALNGGFERNKGRLPVPITGSYMLGSRYGSYNVPGLKNVRLDNKGTNYIGRSGAMARSIFDGEVSAVFQFGGTKNVLVRHGSYISVYCNLSSVRVVKGQKLKTRDIIGMVENDGSGNCVLHFQLRKETQKLNPESWIGR